jgi:5-methylcytosine-specific restriction endonuclease McrA
MTTVFAKHRRIKLNSQAYAQLCRRVLDRDGWRCQKCGRPRGPQVHHLRFRSLLGDDDTKNLITLCSSCHEKIHASPGSDRASR